MKRLGSLLLAAALALALTVPAFAATTFTDIPSGSTLAGEIEKANSYGLMYGYNTTTFGYADPVTRAQFVTVLGRMLGWFTGAQPLGSHITNCHAGSRHAKLGLYFGH